ncbi:MAG: DUF4910 domain-containing protein [Proteobacteria bacterium]|nr:DUF4910 domain-containing protein [Pseudomonadota bacterium]
MTDPGALLDPPNRPCAGEEIYNLAARLFPICRSIAGPGVRETLRLLSDWVPLQFHEVPTGTRAFDWEVPREWAIRDAYIKNAAGERVLDFRANNLHVVSYSAPVYGRFRLDALKPRIHTLPDRPDAIPYRTSYYAETWGFCMTHRALEALPDGEYEARIDATLAPGSLTYGEYRHQGETDEEVLLTAHVCHPSMANDNCSGLALLATLARAIVSRRTRYSYRFLFAPGTIGAIVWLSRNEAVAKRIAHGLILAGVGDRGALTYKQSRRGDAAIDRAIAHVLRHCAPSSRIVAFSPYGYDERQYCSPGFNLPVGLLQRSPFASYPEYHSSADDLSFITPDSLEESYAIVSAALDVIESDKRFLTTSPKCEPQLGRRGLYGSLGGRNTGGADAMLWVLNLSDGRNSLLDIADRAGLPLASIRAAAALLLEHALLCPVPEVEAPS